MSKEQIALSLIIVSFNSKECLRNCLQKLGEIGQTPSFEVIVIDNASSDGSNEMIQSEFPLVKLIQNKNNDGFGAANNIGAYQASGEYLVFLNADAFLQHDTLSQALERMKADSKIGIGGARLINTHGVLQPSARYFPSLVKDFLLLSGIKDPEFKTTSEKNTIEVDWITGAFMIIPKDLYKTVGGFDERFFLYYEEIDLCKKVKAMGYKIVYWKDIIVEHIGGVSSDQCSERVISWRLRSSLLYYRKNHGYTKAWLSKELQQNWHRLRILRNRLAPSATSSSKIQESTHLIQLWDLAWKDTSGGIFSPPKPW